MLRDIARRLRKDVTEAEQFAWKRLRQRQVGNFKFRRQQELGPYIVDFVCLESRLIFELDGGQHAENAEADRIRTQWLEGQGFRVCRVWNHQVFQEWDTIVQELERLLVRTPHPNPPPQGGREPELET
jgi:very-short-patch-repair endonuclease